MVQVFGTSDRPLVDASARFRRPATYGDVIDVRTAIDEWRGTSFVMSHIIARGGDVLVEGREVRVFDRLFTDPQPDAGGKDFKAALNPNSRRVLQAYVEPSLARAAADEKFQFERHGYFTADRVDHSAGRPVFNRITGLKDGWAK